MLKNKRQNGITLIALIITIIVLIILAGVATSLTIGKNGILEKARLAKEKMKNSQTEENAILNDYENIINKQGFNEKIFADMVNFIPKDLSWNVKNVKEALDYLYNN